MQTFAFFSLFHRFSFVSFPFCSFSFFSKSFFHRFSFLFQPFPFISFAFFFLIFFQAKWLNEAQSLHEQGYEIGTTLEYLKRYSVMDSEVSASDSHVLHLLYMTTAAQILQECYPITRNDARDFAALQVPRRRKKKLTEKQEPKNKQKNVCFFLIIFGFSFFSFLTESLFPSFFFGLIFSSFFFPFFHKKN